MMINTVYNEDGEFVREEPFDADVELDKLYPTEQTEQEYIQTCTMEQLAEELLAWWIDGANNYSELGLYSWEVDEAKERIMEWLKQPREGENKQ